MGSQTLQRSLIPTKRKAELLRANQWMLPSGLEAKIGIGNKKEMFLCQHPNLAYLVGED